MQYARARLWLGITCVGSVVTASAAGLLLDAPAVFANVNSAWLAWTLFLLVAVIFLAPFDLMGGWILPRRFGRTQMGFGSFAVAWLRGVLVQTLILFVAGMAVMAAAQTGGPLAALGAATVGMGLLLVAQGPVSRMVARLARNTGGRDGAQIWESADNGFTGGILPLDRHGVIVPALWRDRLSTGVAEILTRRRQAIVASGAGRWGALLAVLWNLLCFGTVMLWLQTDLGTAPGLVAQTLGFNLLSFVGLLLLPAISRLGVYTADRAALARGADPRDLAAAIEALDAVDEHETKRSPELESVFHPIPCAARRIEYLERGGMPGGPFWHVARYALYLSWACLGLLGRAVHCNCGRPALWVLLPAD